MRDCIQHWLCFGSRSSTIDSNCALVEPCMIRDDLPAKNPAIWLVVCASQSVPNMQAVCSFVKATTDSIS